MTNQHELMGLTTPEAFVITKAMVSASRRIRGGLK